MNTDPIRHNPERHITRFVHPDGLMTIFPLDVTLEEANTLGTAMEEMHVDIVMRAMLTETLPSIMRIARGN